MKAASEGSNFLEKVMHLDVQRSFDWHCERDQLRQEMKKKIGFLLCILYDVIYGRKIESMHSVTKLYIEALSQAHSRRETCNNL
ncbi:hypothetical protein YC2023_047031 [Brassica napus]